MISDGNSGKIMTHFIGLGATCYKYKTEGSADVRKLEGIKSMDICLMERLESRLP